MKDKVARCRLDMVDDDVAALCSRARDLEDMVDGLLDYFGVREGGKKSFHMVKKDLDGAVLNIRNRIKSLEGVVGVEYVPPSSVPATVVESTHVKVKRGRK